MHQRGQTRLTPALAARVPICSKPSPTLRSPHGAQGEPTMGRGTARVPDITAILAVIAPEALISFLEASLPPNDGCLTDEQKFALLCELDRQILDTERAESTLLFQAWEVGADILPRQDAAPAAVLAVAT